LSRDQVIVDSQAWRLAFSAKGPQFAAAKGYAPANAFKLVEWLAENYPWTNKKDPVSGWQSRLVGLEGENEEHLAFKKYNDFMLQTAELRATVHESAAQLDASIQNQIDAARGK
jgi:hypothetical protein